MTHDEVVMQLRGLLARAVVGAVDDTGDVQTVDLASGDGVDRSLVEVMQPYGFGSLPPDAQPSTVVLSIGGDQGHQVAMPLWSAYRFGKLLPGEVAAWHWGGSRLHFRNGGSIDLLAAALLDIMAQTITVAAAGGITISGPVTFQSPVTFTGAVTFEADVAVQGNLTVGGAITGKDAAGKAV